MSLVFWQIIGVVLIVLGTAIGGVATYISHFENEATIQKLRAADQPEEIASRSLNWNWIKAREESYAGDLSQKSRMFISDQIYVGEIDPKYLPILQDIYNQTEFDPEIPSNSADMYGNLKYLFGFHLLQDSEFLDKNPDIFFELLKGHLSIAFFRHDTPEVRQRFIRLGIEKIYENNGFINQSYFSDLDQFFYHISSSETELVYELVRSRSEKQYIYKEYFVESPIGLPANADYWGRLLKAEFPED